MNEQYNYIHHRRKGRPGNRKAAPPELIATGPNQVWSWDITWLKTSVMGIFFYAYVIIDVWSRKIVGWEVHLKESDEIAAELFKRLASEQNLRGVRLHSDNGNPIFPEYMSKQMHDPVNQLSNALYYHYDTNQSINHRGYVLCFKKEGGKLPRYFYYNTGIYGGGDDCPTLP